MVGLFRHHPKTLILYWRDTEAWGALCKRINGKKWGGAGTAKTRGQDKTGAVDLRVSQLRDLGLSSGRDFPDSSGPWRGKGMGGATRASKSGFLPQQLPPSHAANITFSKQCFGQNGLPPAV